MDFMFSMFNKDEYAKRAVALLISAALMASLASCGGSGKSTKRTAQNSNSIQTTRTEDSPNIIEFDDSDDEEDTDESSDSVTTTTTSAPSRTKKTTTTASASTSTSTSTTASTTKATTKKSTTAKSTTTTSKTTAKTTTTQPASQLSNQYKVTSKTYTSTSGNIKYKYPQITGLYDETMQAFYNDYFKSDCLKYLDESGLESFSGTFEVKYKTKSTLSILFRESFYYSGAAHGYTSAHAITIDLATGNTVIPSETVDMDKAADAINNDTWILTRSADGVTKKNIVDYFNQYDEEQMKSSISVDNVVRIKNSGGKYTVSGKTGCNSYLDVNGDPVLILEVNHALGDYVEVQF